MSFETGIFIAFALLVFIGGQLQRRFGKKSTRNGQSGSDGFFGGDNDCGGGDGGGD